MNIKFITHQKVFSGKQNLQQVNIENFQKKIIMEKKKEVNILVINLKVVVDKNKEEKLKK